MNAHRIETTLDETKTLTLRDLPFRAGAEVEVIVLETNHAGAGNGAPEAGSTPGVAQGSEEEDWVESLLADVHEFWESEGERPDIPRDWGARFDDYKPQLIKHD